MGEPISYLANIVLIYCLRTDVQDGKVGVTFGVVFEATKDSMPALSAAIHTAKKRGVIQYEGLKC